MTTTFKYPFERKLEPLNVRIPAWIPSVEDIAATNGLDADRMRVMLHQFFLSYLMNRKLRRIKANKNYLPDFFPVSSALLRQTCTDNYLKFVDALVEAKVIERRVSEEGRRSYLVGGHAQLYRWRVPDTHYGGCSFRRERVTGYKQIKSVLRTRDQHFTACEQAAVELSQSNHVYSVLLSYLNDAVFDDKYHEESEKYIVTSDLRFLESEAWSNRDFSWYSRDGFGHRLHHPVTSMPKEYRKHLRFKERLDEPLAVLDIRNSQPYFSAVISNKALNATYMGEFQPLLEHITYIEMKPDFLLYRQLCVEGRLYEFMMEGMGLDTKDENERDKVKELLFASVLFGRTRVFGDKSRFREAFRMVFPSVHEMFQLIKRADETLLPELKDIIKPAGKKFKYEKSNDAYKLIACMMQRAESAMMYQVIAPKLIEAGIKFISVHDSVIIPIEHIESTVGIFKASFENLGLPAPTLSIK